MNRVWSFGRFLVLPRFTNGIGFYIHSIAGQLRPALIVKEDEETGEQLTYQQWILYSATCFMFPLFTIEIGVIREPTEEDVELSNIFSIDFDDDEDDEDDTPTV